MRAASARRHHPLAGQGQAGLVENGIFSALDWFPTLVAAAGNPNITDQLLKGVQLGDRTYKNHLDGYNQFDLLQGKGPSARNEFFYFGGPHLGAVRVDDFKFQFYHSPRAGRARRSRPTCRPWSISARIRSSGRPRSAARA